jgi:hypothetical protein
MDERVPIRVESFFPNLFLLFLILLQVHFHVLHESVMLADRGRLISGEPLIRVLFSALESFHPVQLIRLDVQQFNTVKVFPILLALDSRLFLIQNPLCTTLPRLEVRRQLRSSLFLLDFLVVQLTGFVLCKANKQSSVRLGRTLVPIHWSDFKS